MIIYDSSKMNFVWADLSHLTSAYPLVSARKMIDMVWKLDTILMVNKRGVKYDIIKFMMIINVFGELQASAITKPKYSHSSFC